MSATRSALIFVSCVLLATRAFAHHSSAMFDDHKNTTLNGTVKAFQWTTPHCWSQVLVPGGDGSDEWSVEIGAPSQLFHGGLTPKAVHAGDKITLIVHPMRDGTNAGLF